MSRKKRTSVHILTSVVILTLFLTVVILFFKNSNFNKTIPDVSEISAEVQKSIANLKPTRQLMVPILLYHYVEYVQDRGDTIRQSLNILPVIFDQQVKTLQDAGYNFMTPSDLADVLDEKKDLPQKAVILTFDDGYRDFYTNVFPILKKYRVKAVAYIVPNFLNKHNNLDLWMLKEIAQSGLVEIGAHTMDHSYLAGLSKKNVEYEIVESKRYLEKALGIEVVSFAYPYGAFDNQAIQVVKEAGFKTAVTTIEGTLVTDTNRFFLYRVRPGARVRESLIHLLRK